MGISELGEQPSLVVRGVAELAEEEDRSSESGSTAIWRKREDISESRLAVTSNSSEGVSNGANGAVFLGLSARARVSLLIVVEHLSSSRNGVVLPSSLVSADNVCAGEFSPYIFHLREGPLFRLQVADASTLIGRRRMELGFDLGDGFFEVALELLESLIVRFMVSMEFAAYSFQFSKSDAGGEYDAEKSDKRDGVGPRHELLRLHSFTFRER